MCCILPVNALSRALAEESGPDKFIYGVHMAMPPRVGAPEEREAGESDEMPVMQEVKAKRGRPLAQLKMCEHNMRKSACKDCARCPHDRLKRTCRDCGGPAICIHKKRKSTCRECGGSQICCHNRRRSHCKDCGGSEICEHKVRSPFPCTITAM